MFENPATTEPNKDDRLRVEIIAFQPDQRRRDLDNMLKAPLDALQACGAYHDDSQIDELIICRAYDKENPRLEVGIVTL
jgi:crossover junction endodeoxyribonuclease RusA